MKGFDSFSFSNGKSVKKNQNETGQMFSSLLHLRVNVHSAEVAYSPPEISSHLMFWTLPPTERCHIHHSLSKCYCFKPSCITMSRPLTRAITSVQLLLLRSFAARWRRFTRARGFSDRSLCMTERALGTSSRLAYNTSGVCHIVWHHCKGISRKNLWKSLACEWRESNLYAYLLGMF